MAVTLGAVAFTSQSAFGKCSDITRTKLQTAVDAAAAAGGATGGYGLAMWVTFVDETGKVCQVITGGTANAAGAIVPGAFSAAVTSATGSTAGNTEWLGSRVISAQKANTANAFSLDAYAISTANLYSAVQPKGSLFGLQFSNPVDASTSYQGSPASYGTVNDPLVGRRVGGVNVFGGGLALYKSGKKIGAIGVSGDTSCRDHAYAWRIRADLIANAGQQNPPRGITTFNANAAGAPMEPVSAIGTVGDEMIINGAGDWAGWSHPACPNSTSATLISNGSDNGEIIN